MKKRALLLVLLIVFSGGIVYGIQDKATLPDINKIKEKKYYKELNTLKEKEQFDKYINNLNKKEALTMIAEFAEEFDKTGDYTQIGIFSEYITNNLINELDENDYIEVLNNTEYNKAFKVLMIDMYTSSKLKNKEKNSKVFDNKLKEIIKDTNKDSSLRFYSLASIENVNSNDIEMLTNIIKSDIEDKTLKALSIKVIAKVNQELVDPIIENIIERHDEYSIEEVNMATSIMSRTLNNLESAAKSIDLSAINSIIENSNEKLIIHSTVRSLGNIENKNSVDIVIKHRNKIDDDTVIAYFIDKNYLTIDAMLDVTNDIDTIKTALECVDIAPFINFIPKLEILSKQHKREDIRSSANMLIEKANRNSYQRNIKWDY